MSSLSPEQLAKRFLDLQIRNEVIPLDDQNLGEELWWQRFQRRELSPACLEYMTEMEEVVDHANISSFFRSQIIWEAGLQFGSGFIDPNAITSLVREFYGISIDEKKYGIFDKAEIAEPIEDNFLRQILPILRYREKKGAFNPTDWREWQSDRINRGRRN